MTDPFDEGAVPASSPTTPEIPEPAELRTAQGVPTGAEAEARSGNPYAHKPSFDRAHDPDADDLVMVWALKGSAPRASSTAPSDGPRPPSSRAGWSCPTAAANTFAEPTSRERIWCPTRSEGTSTAGPKRVVPNPFARRLAAE